MRRFIAKCTLLITLFVAVANCAACKRKETPAPTVSPDLNSEASATVAPTKVPLVVINPPEATPEPTMTPEATTTPVLQSSPSIAPTATPEATTTPVPTTVPVVPEGVKPVASVQMGDNVWYDFYEDNTLVVRGTGATYDFPNSYERQLYMMTYTKVFNDKYTSDDFTGVLNEAGTRIIIEEGVTELGDNCFAFFSYTEQVVFPSSLKKIGNQTFYGTGYSNDTKWIGLDTDKVEIASTAFLACGGSDNIKNADKFRATPTPTPAPTATPVPNPNKPRLVEKKKMGDNVTYEFWDNGYLYVKGTGATWDQSFYFDDFAGEFYQTIKKVIVEEGITYIGEFSLSWMKHINYWEVPKSLTSVGNTCGGGNGPITFHGYSDGIAITVTTTKSACLESFYDALADIQKAKETGYVITFD